MKAKCNDCGTVLELTPLSDDRVEMGLDIFCPTCNRNTSFEPLGETQENYPKAGDHQVEVEVEGNKFWADPEMVPLLTELNKAGLKTRSHCSGHGNEHAWVVLRMENIEDVQVRKNGDYDELIIGWKPPEGFAQPGEE